MCCVGGFGSVKFKIRWCSVEYAALRLYGVVVWFLKSLLRSAKLRF